MKKTAYVMLAVFVFQFFFSPTVYAVEAKLENVPALQDANSESPPPIPAKDEEFAKHSRKATQFTFKDLPKHLILDIKDSFWGWGALGFAVGAGLSAGLYQKDKDIEYSFQQNAMFGSTGDEILSQMGAPYTMAGVGIVTAIVGAGIHNEKLLTTGEVMLESLFWAELITLGGKYAFSRTRPNGGKNSFPSAHAAGVFSTATVLQMMYGWKAGVPAYAFASLVALARVDDYQHFPSDVLMGATIGTVIAYGTSKYHKKLHNNFTVVPEISKDRYGLLLYHEF